MIGFFPTPYPDELLYSICARYSLRVQYPSKLSINQELFGINDYVAVIDLPQHLNYLTNNLPDGHSLSADSLISSNTLFPFYSPFLSPGRAKLVRARMKAGSTSSVQQSAGLIGCTIHSPALLRYCPRCAKHDRKAFGETYWHRLHQIPGVEVCPDHSAFLEDSSVSTLSYLNNALYVTAEQAIQSGPPRLFALSDLHSRTLVNIAQDAAWLLTGSDLAHSINVIRGCYMRIFTEEGMATPNGRFRQRLLVDRFTTQYSKNLLRLLQCDFGNPSSNWLVLFLNTLKGKSSIHPLRHLLLIHCLGYTVESFFDRCKTDTSHPTRNAATPFGKGPWPCLNPACGNFRKLKVTVCRIAYKKRHGLPTGKFRCTCGFTYQRRGPDISPLDQFVKSRVATYGPVWEAELRKQWDDTSTSLCGMAKWFGSSTLTIKFHATRLGLTFPRIGVRNKWTRFDPKLRRQSTTSNQVEPQSLKFHRKQLLNALKVSPSFTRTELRNNVLPNTYYWLSKHDKEWLAAHLPHLKRNGRAVDWVERDANLVVEVRRAALELRTTIEIPIRITRQLIIKRMAKRTTMLKSKYLSRCPQTTAALTEAVESRLELAIRRIRWAAERFLQENVVPSESALARRSRVVTEIWNIPAAKAAFEEAMSSLRELDKSITEAA